MCASDPRELNMSKLMHRIGVLLPQQMWEKLTALRSATGISVNEHIRRALETYLN